METPQHTPHSAVDAYSPREIAALVEGVGVAKARLPVLDTLMLGNIVGGSIFVALVYWLAYLRRPASGGE